MRKDAKKLANNGNGLILANYIIINCTNYEKLYITFITNMKEGCIKDLALDMVAYSILKNLSEKRDIYEELDDKAQVAKPLQNLADFTAMFF